MSKSKNIQDYEEALEILREELESVYDSVGKVICERRAMSAAGAIASAKYITGEWAYPEESTYDE